MKVINDMKAIKRNETFIKKKCLNERSLKTNTKLEIKN